MIESKVNRFLSSTLGLIQDPTAMTDFLQDPMYLDFMDKGAERALGAAKQAADEQRWQVVLDIVSEAKEAYGPSAYVAKHLEEFERLRADAEARLKS